MLDPGEAPIPFVDSSILGVHMAKTALAPGGDLMLVPGGLGVGGGSMAMTHQDCVHHSEEGTPSHVHRVSQTLGEFMTMENREGTSHDGSLVFDAVDVIVCELHVFLEPHSLAIHQFRG